MKISVIIPCLNAERTVEAQLKALANQQLSAPWEVIISDNGCTDTTIERALRYKDILPNLRIIDAGKRQGTSFAMNQGAQVAQAESLAFCDADDEVGEGWLSALANALETHDFVACVPEASKLNSPSKFNSHSIAASRLELPRFWLPPHFPFVGSGLMGIKRKVFQELGGFDEDLFSIYCEDKDFCAKAWMAGIPIYLESKAIVHIRHRQSLRSLYRQRRMWGEYNVLIAKKYQFPNESPIHFLKLLANRWRHVLWSTPKLLIKSEWRHCARMWGQCIGITRGAWKYGCPSL